MSFDVGGGGIAAAIQQSIVQTPLSSQPAALAQQFEAGLQRASETSAMAAKQAEEAYRKASEIGDRDRKLINKVQEVQVQPAPLPNAMDEKVVDYLESFHDRTKNFSGIMNEVVKNVGGSGDKPSVEISKISTSGAMPGTGPNDLQVAIEMLEKSFAFAIETTLVSKASTESTRVFNNLLKGQ